MKRLLLPFLLAGSLLAQAPQVPVTGNLGAGGTFPLINSPQVIFAADSDHTMAFPEMTGSSGFLFVTSGATLTATRKLIAPVVKGFTWTIENATTGGQSIQVIGSTGTGVTIANGVTVTVSCDGTNYVSTTANGFAISQAVTFMSSDPSNVPNPTCHSGFTCTNLGGVFDVVPTGGPSGAYITLSWSTPISGLFCRASNWGVEGGTPFILYYTSFTPVSGGKSWRINFPTWSAGAVATLEYTCALQ